MRIIQGVAVADELVREILALERAGTTLDAIGRRFHLSRAAVEKVVRRRASTESVVRHRATSAPGAREPVAAPIEPKPPVVPAAPPAPAAAPDAPASRFVKLDDPAAIRSLMGWFLVAAPADMKPATRERDQLLEEEELVALANATTLAGPQA